MHSDVEQEVPLPKIVNLVVPGVGVLTLGWGQIWYIMSVNN